MTHSTAYFDILGRTSRSSSGPLLANDPSIFWTRSRSDPEVAQYIHKTPKSKNFSTPFALLELLSEW